MPTPINPPALDAIQRWVNEHSRDVRDLTPACVRPGIVEISRLDTPDNWRDDTVVYRTTARYGAVIQDFRGVTPVAEEIALIEVEAAQQWLVDAQDRVASAVAPAAPDPAVNFAATLNEELRRLADQGGGTYTIPPGTYYLSERIRQPPNTHVRGHGATLHAAPGLQVYWSWIGGRVDGNSSLTGVTIVGSQARDGFVGRNPRGNRGIRFGTLPEASTTQLLSADGHEPEDL